MKDYLAEAFGESESSDFDEKDYLLLAILKRLGLFMGRFDDLEEKIKKSGPRMIPSPS